ncbi:hypothetical protein AgCh_004313 [Apium graveolens]
MLGTSIISDGWTNIKKKSLINVIASNSRGSMFLYAEDFSDVEKTGKEISNFLLKAIDEVGSSNVLQVITNNAANCKAAGKEIEKDWLNSGDERTKELGREVTAAIKDEVFWDEIDNILAITKPIYRMIKFADGEGQKMGEIYEKMDCMIGEISEVMKNNKHEIDHEKMNEIMFSRRAPNCDREVVQGVLKAFDKIGEDEEERRVLRHQLASFQGKEGMFGSLAAKIDAVTMSPISWWSTYGAETPQLSEIAIKILSQPISSSSAERVWSTYSYIHNIKRNRLTSVRADKLVYIHTNIRLISRFTSSYKEGPYRKWDIDAENSYLEDSMAKLDELRSKDDGIEEKSETPVISASKRKRYSD